MRTSLSVAVPAYNEGTKLISRVETWAKFLRTKKFPGGFEIVICNDGSQDDTGTILDELARRIPEIKAIHFETNRGASAALAAAIQKTKMQWVLLQDADGQFPIENLETFIEKLTESPESLAFSGVRAKKMDSIFNRFGSYVSGALCNFSHGSHLKDFNCAFKLILGELIRAIPIEARGMNYSLDITSKLIEAGVDQVEIPIETKATPAPARSLRSNFIRSRDRLYFVGYVSLRQTLLKHKILMPPTVHSEPSENPFIQETRS